MIRISSKRVDLRTIVSVAGKLEVSHLADLQLHCHDTPAKIILDLSDLMSADEAAIRWLGERVERGYEILGASPYIKFQLERERRSSESLTNIGIRGAGEDGE